MFRIALAFFLLANTTLINAQTFSHIEYQGSEENFANPERGFYHSISSFNYDNLVSMRENEAITLVYHGYHLDDFKDKEIPQWFLQQMAEDFDVLRKAGIKEVLRFSYTEKSTPPYGDAPPEIVQNHIAQLKPILQANSDVIYILQSGFIGAWGEWYYSDYYSEWPGHITEEQWGYRRNLVYSLLDAMPADRMVQIRTPYYKKNILQQEAYAPLTENEAFTNTAIARIAHHNDCFVADNSDMGTYRDTTIEKPYLAQDSKFTLVGGETCQVCTCASCENSMKELRRFHWSFLNIDYHTGVLQGWIDEGCFPTIQKKLGYRYRMLSAKIQNETKSWGKFNLDIKLMNDGWSNPGNPRNIEIILKNNSTNEEYYFPVQDEIRKWPLTDTIFIHVDAGIPSMPEGEYSLYLNFPDPDPRLANKPAFSMRTANQDTWVENSGYNSVLKTIVINNENSTPAYNGGNFFKPKKNIVQTGQNIKIDGDPSDWIIIAPSYIDNTQKTNVLKFYNTSDSLYFLAQGNQIIDNHQLFIDADKNSGTGFNSLDWTTNGADYLIESNILYTYSGTNHEWGWSEIGNVDVAANDTIIEIGFARNQLNQVNLNNPFAIGLINYLSGDVVSYLPKQFSDFLSIYQITIFGKPLALNSTTYTNNNILFWANAQVNPSVYCVLEHSEDGVNYNQVYVGKNDFVSFTDKNLDEDKTYSYRLQYKDANNYSEYRELPDVTTFNSEKVFINIKLDGNSDDWNIVGPSGTAFDGEMIALRMTEAGENLLFSLSAQLIQSYYLLFDTDDNHVFDFKISNDSLFSFQGNSWLFDKMISSYSTDGFLEAGIQLADIKWNDAYTMNVFANVNGFNMPNNANSFHYIKLNSVPASEYFYIEPSSDDYYTRLVVKWTKTDNTEGYIIERSIGDTLNFEFLADKSKNSTYYIDMNLDSSMVYYYRMFSYNGIYRSVYSPIRLGKPGTGMGIHELEPTSNAKLAIAPNPFHQASRLNIEVTKPEELTVQLYDNTLRVVKVLFKGKVLENKTIELNREKLNSGLYFVRIFGPSTNLMNKIIIE